MDLKSDRGVWFSKKPARQIIAAEQILQSYFQLSEMKNSPTSKNIRQVDIARQVGVSVSTVSKVLNGNEGIGSDVRNRILQLADQLGYKRKKANNENRLKHIGLFSSLSMSSSDDFYFNILSGVEAECQRQDILFSFATIDASLLSNSNKLKAWFSTRIKTQNVDGLIFLSSYEIKLLEYLSENQYPVVIINEDCNMPAADLYLPDNWGGPQAAMNFLIENGHKRILHITHSDRETLHKRFMAGRAAMLDAGLSFDPTLVLDTPLNLQAVYEAMRGYLAKGLGGITAVSCCSDWAAAAVIRALNEADIKIPDDVSVIGFDDTTLAASVVPALTTVRIDCRKLGALAVRGLIQRKAYPDSPPCRHQMATELIVRDSVAQNHQA
jgi:DNA-binding LacI/PurR family transcriptional regulator